MCVSRPEIEYIMYRDSLQHFFLKDLKTINHALMNTLYLYILLPYIRSII